MLLCASNKRHYRNDPLSPHSKEARATQSRQRAPDYVLADSRTKLKLLRMWALKNSPLQRITLDGISSSPSQAMSPDDVTRPLGRALSATL